MRLQYRVAKKREAYPKLARALGEILVEKQRASHMDVVRRCGFEGLEDSIVWEHVVALLLAWIKGEDLELIPDPIAFQETLATLDSHTEFTPLTSHAFKRHEIMEETRNPAKFVAGSGGGRTTEGYAFQCPQNAHLVDAHVCVRKSKIVGQVKGVNETRNNALQNGHIEELTSLPFSWDSDAPKQLPPGSEAA